MEELLLQFLRKSLLSAALLLAFVNSAVALYFQRADSSYCIYERWNATVNGTLKFEFRTPRENALLLYMDDRRDHNDFLELSLQSRKLRFRFRIRNNARTFFLGNSLDDSEWHQVAITRSGKSCIITLDEYTMDGSVEGQDDELTIATNLYVGGIPKGGSVQLSELSSQDAWVMPHLQGYVRNLVYRTNFSRFHFERLELLARHYVGEDPKDLCSSFDPCHNRGLCVSTDLEFYCDCTGTGFEGESCETAATDRSVQSGEATSDESKGTSLPECQAIICTIDGNSYINYCQLQSQRQAIIGTFDGNSYISYTLETHKIQNNEDDLYFQFRTAHPNGLILHVGESEDFLYAALVKGHLEVAINLGSGEYRAEIMPEAGESFYDNEWHMVKVIRRWTNVEVAVDDSLRAEGRTEGNFGKLTTQGEFFIGGARAPAELQGSTVGENFIGNLQDVSYNGLHYILDFLELASNDDPFILIEGNVVFEIQEVSTNNNSITFLTEESFLLLQKWDARATSDLFFAFRTNEPDSVIMYSRGEGSKVTAQDFFAFELSEGFLYLILNLGSGAIRHKASTLQLNDGQWHSVRLTRKGKDGSVIVDSQEEEDGREQFVTPGDSTHLNLGDDLVLGGINDLDDSTALPMELFSGVARRGFVGCLKNLLIENSITTDFPRIIREQRKEEEIKSYCRDETDKCTLEPEPCQHGGLCKEGWNRFICDCRMTSYSGPTCEDVASHASFNGVQYVRVSLRLSTQTKVEDIFFRFQTRFPEGMLVMTSSPRAIDILLIELHQGILRVTTDFGNGKTVLRVGEHLDDNRWHAVHVVRREAVLMVTVDDSDRAEAPEDFEGGILNYHFIEIGGFVDQDSGHAWSNGQPGFKGQMEQFVYNGKYYFELAEQTSPSSIEVTASFEDDIGPRPVLNPYTFQTKEVFVQLPTPKTYPRLTFFFHFRTTEPDGLILYDRGMGQDYIAVELLAGRLHYVFNRGSGTTSIQDSTMHPLNDNKWHEVWIFQDSRDRDLLMVDGSVAADRAAEGATNIDLTENLFVGGVSESAYVILPVMVQARKGYQGCFGSLEINYELQNLLDTAVSIENDKDQLKEGCTELSSFCNDDVCMNGGLCLAGWEEFTCDCSATSFTGKNCSDPSITFQFGASGGLIAMTLPEDQWATTDRDEISMGFLTTSDDSVLMRIDSATSDDYIEMEIVRGKLVVVYNFGTEDIPVIENNIPVNDGLYHVVHFSRRGANATLQVDNNAPQYTYPGGRQAQHFNKQAMVNIGARGSSVQRKRRRRTAEQRSFEGTLSGISYNEIRPLDIAAAGDPRIAITGDVMQIPSPEFDRTWPSRAPNRIGTAQTTLETLPEFSTDNDLRRTPKQPTIASPQSTSLETQDGGTREVPPKKNPVILPTADGIFTTNGRNIFVSSVGCITEDDEGCESPRLPANQIFSLDTTQTSQIPPSANSPCHRDDEDCSAGSGINAEDGETEDNIKFTATSDIPGRVPPKDPTEVDNHTTEPGNDSHSTGTGLDFIGQTGLVIGVVALGAILFIVIVLVLYRCRNRNEGSYHINESRNYDEATRTNLLPTPQTNGTVPPKPKPKLPAEYASKEWYV